MAGGPVEKIVESVGNDYDYLMALATLNMHAGVVGQEE